jgi:hypothetical protein
MLGLVVYAEAFLKAHTTSTTVVYNWFTTAPRMDGSVGDVELVYERA